MWHSFHSPLQYWYIPWYFPQNCCWVAVLEHHVIWSVCYTLFANLSRSGRSSSRVTNAFGFTFSQNHSKFRDVPYPSAFSFVPSSSALWISKSLVCWVADRNAGQDSDEWQQESRRRSKGADPVRICIASTPTQWSYERGLRVGGHGLSIPFVHPWNSMGIPCILGIGGKTVDHYLHPHMRVSTPLCILGIQWASLL